MITVDEARERILRSLTATEALPMKFQSALGRVLAADAVAARTQPPFAASAMDGYAVRSADMGDVPVTLDLVGESAAGHGFEGHLEPGTAARISTGAPLPDGADQVVIQEKTERSGDRVTLADTQRPMANVRSAGIDFREGDTLLRAGTRLTPEAIALAAGQVLADVPEGYASIANFRDKEVPRRKRILLSASFILFCVGAALLAYLLLRGAGEPVYLGIARDTPASVRDTLARGGDLDLVVTIGGASVGDHDHLRQVFNDEGGALDFEKIAIKPGKPTWFGQLRGVPHLGLPGNPVSALVIARLLLRPAVTRLNGAAATTLFETATLDADLSANDHRETYLRSSRTADGRVAPLSNQDSSALSALVRANCLIRRTINAKAARRGDLVEILTLDGRD